MRKSKKIKSKKIRSFRYALLMPAAAAVLWAAQPVQCLTAPAQCLAAPVQCLAAPVIAVFPEEGRTGEISGGPGVNGKSASGTETENGFEADRFVLPEEARVLVVVEGTGGSRCRVYAYERSESGWEQRLETEGYLGLNGMSNHRISGDKTTPIGVFQMNTPFGQDDPLEGFPSNYLKVKESHVWTDDTNVMVDDGSAVGEHVGTFWYDEYYDYAIDAGFNRNGIAGQGSALFLHCIGQGKDYTSGCVAIPKDQMIAVMRLYGKYGDGACYIAQAPEGTFDQIYDTYGVNQGLSPDGNFE